MVGKYFWDDATTEFLTSDGSNIDGWAKISSPLFDTPEGPAEIHLYRNLENGQLNLGRGFKIIFKNSF